jgi:hypothetical protein
MTAGPTARPGRPAQPAATLDHPPPAGLTRPAPPDRAPGVRLGTLPSLAFAGDSRNYRARFSGKSKPTKARFSRGAGLAYGHLTAEDGRDELARF